jgi:hypothetical protein
MDTYDAAYWSSDPSRLSSSDEEEEKPDSIMLWVDLSPEGTEEFVGIKINMKGAKPR